jgi:hypothetical protein
MAGVSTGAHLSDHGGPRICARLRADAVAVCGKRPPSPWTDRRSFVTCGACIAEIDRRLAARAKG